MRICSVPGCVDKVRSKGMCGMHYTRVRRNGSPYRANLPDSRIRAVRQPCDGICQKVLDFLADGQREIVPMALKMRLPPELIVRHLIEHGAKDVVALLRDQGQKVPPRTPHDDVVCPDCGVLVQSWGVGNGNTLQAVLATHTCKQRNAQ